MFGKLIAPDLLLLAEDIFAFELNRRMRDPSTLPESRTAVLFHDWFDVELISELIDLGKGRMLDCSFVGVCAPYGNCALSQDESPSRGSADWRV